ncbi:MAG: lysylphosphatidylglycerol synthase transmembrane domain-containing protein [Anaerolineales bacterium]
MSASRTSWRWLPGAVISLLLIALILRTVDLPKTLQALRQANYPLLGFAFLLSLLWLALRAVVWRTLLRNRPAYTDVLFTAAEGYLLNNFLPFRLGELGRALILSRKTDLSFGAILPTILVERVVDLGFSALFLLAALPFVLGAAGARTLGWIVGALVLVGLFALYLLARFHQHALAFFHRISQRWPRLQARGGKALEAFLQGLSVITEWRVFLLFLGWMTLNWLLAWLAYFVMTLAYFPQATPIWGLFGLGAAAFGGAIPSLPGAIGTFEGAFGGALTLLSGDPSTALAVALTARLYNYFNSGLLGTLGLARDGESLAHLYAQLRTLRNPME